jgi:hypothetical protein
MNRTGRGLLELLDSFSNWFFLWVSAACANVSEDVNFRTGDFNTFKSTDRKEFGGEEGDIRVVALTGTMICTPGKCIRFTHGLARLVMKLEVEPSEVK